MWFKFGYLEPRENSKHKVEETDQNTWKGIIHAKISVT